MAGTGTARAKRAVATTATCGVTSARRRRAPLDPIGRSPAARPEEGATHTLSHSPKIIYFMLYRLNILYLCEFFRSVCVQCEIFAR